MFRLGAVLSIALIPSIGWAVAGPATTTPAEYKVTVSKIELCTNAGCTDSVVLGSGSSTFDIASASVGAEVGSFVSEFSLPPGKIFTHIKSTVSRTISVKATSATVDSGNGASCVTGGVSVTQASSATQTDATVDVTGAPAVSAQDFVVPNTDATNAPAGLAAAYTSEGITLVDASTMTFTKRLTGVIDTNSTAPVGTFDIAFDVSGTMTFQRAGADSCSVYMTGSPGMTVTVSQ